tara:strand:+ start:1612 stop:2304 length:693 start_codon:yes stop_codon:yes gene_type:complete
MAATKTPQDAFDYVKSYLKGMPLSAISPEMLDQVSKRMWMAAAWRWTIGSLPAKTIVTNTQDYTITTPSDFLLLFNGFISDGANVYRDIIIEPQLPEDVKVVGNPSRVSFEGSSTYRLFPKPGTIPNSPAQQLILRYKKMAPVIDTPAMTEPGSLIFDDEWFWVFCEGVLWKAYLWGDDNRAGNVTVSPNGIQYTGQAAVFQDAIKTMAEHEKLPLIEPHDLVNPKQGSK